MEVRQWGGSRTVNLLISIFNDCDYITRLWVSRDPCRYPGYNCQLFSMRKDFHNPQLNCRQIYSVLLVSVISTILSPGHPQFTLLVILHYERQYYWFLTLVQPYALAINNSRYDIHSKNKL